MTNQRTTLVLDSSQISVLMDCEERWRLLQIEQIIRIDPFNPLETLRPSDAISMGLLFHKLLEIYNGNSFRLGTTGAMHLALCFDPNAADVQDEHQYPLEPKLITKVFDRFKDYLIHWSTQRDRYQVSFRNKPIIKVHPITGMPFDSIEQVPLVEQGFSFPLLDTPEFLFVLEGRIDFIGHCENEPLWMDHKTQARAHNLYKKSIQFRNYALATGFPFGVIDYIRLTEKIDKTTFVREPISFSPLEMIHWKQELIEFYVKTAHHIERNELSLNRGACGNSFGSPCQFTSICEEYNPTMREQIKKDQFTKRKVWKPW